MNNGFDAYLGNVVKEICLVRNAEHLNYQIESKDNGLIAQCKACKTESPRLTSATLKQWMRDHSAQPHQIDVFTFTCLACPEHTGSFDNFKSIHRTEAAAVEAREAHLESKLHQNNRDEEDYFKMPPPDEGSELPTYHSLRSKA